MKVQKGITSLIIGL